MNKEDALILWFKDVNNKDVSLVGGKNASLGEMYQELTPKGIRIPNGFVITSKGYRHFIEESKLKDDIEKHLSGLDTHDMKDLQKRGRAIRTAFLLARFPKDLEDEI